MLKNNELKKDKRKGGENVDREIKSIDLLEFKATDKGEFEGYAAYFNNVDSYEDMIMPGAFGQVDPSSVKLFFNHNWSGVPIGVVTMLEEDEKGLKFKAKLNETTLGKDVKEALKTGAINKMSIGYRVNGCSYEKIEDKTVRKITGIDLMEISPVNFPANDMAEITSYKSTEVKELKDDVKELKTQLTAFVEMLKDLKKETIKTEDEEKSEILEQLNKMLNEED